MALDSITQMPNLPITSAFKASMPAAPKGRIGPKEIAPAAEELSSAISTAEQKVGEADINIEKAKREEKASELELKAESKKKFVEDIESMPERLAYKEAVKQERGMEFVPTRDTVQDIAGLFGLIGVVGMVIGKGNAMQAMGAMNGMMEGHRKGRQDLFKQEVQQFEKNFKAMQAKVSAALADYQEALKVKQQDSEAGELMAQVALARAESPFLKAVKDKQGDAAVLERLKEVNKSVTVDMPKTINTLQEKAEQRAHQRVMENLAERRMQRLESTPVGGTKGGKDFGSTSELVENTTGARLKDKDAAEVAIAANAVGDASAIKQIVKEHPEWVGRSGQIRNFFNRTIESINLGQPAPDDKGQPELIFAKRYAEYLANYERALAGGARGFTVYFQRRFNALLEQNQFNAAGMSNLMDEQIRTITSQVASKSEKITRESLGRLARNIKERAGDEDAVRGLSGEGKAFEQPSAPQAGTQPKEGDKDKSKSGKPIVYRNGAWEYE